jgi:hypothetical protein
VKKVVQLEVLQQFELAIRDRNIPLSQMGSKGKSSRCYRLEHTDQTEPYFFLELDFWPSQEAFTANLLWSPIDRLPKINCEVEPEVAVHKQVGALNIQMLWSSIGFGWEIQGPPPPIVTKRSIRQIAIDADNRVTVDSAREELPKLLDDFFAHWHRDVIPFINRIKAVYRRGWQR